MTPCLIIYAFARVCVEMAVATFTGQIYVSKKVTFLCSLSVSEPAWKAGLSSHQAGPRMRLSMYVR